MKMTVLEMTQDILSDMDSDEVNSISDTMEAMQVANIIRSTFYEILSRKEWQHLRKVAPLDNVSDSTKPTYMKLPERVTRVDKISYDKARVTETQLKIQQVKYKYPDEFLELVNKRNSDNSIIDTSTTFNGLPLLVYNDRPPEFYTSFDDEYIVFDSYDSAKESTLQSGNSQVIYYQDPTFTFEDGFTPDLPHDAFPLLLAEAKSVCSLRLRQTPDEKAEQQSTRQNRAIAQRAFKVKGGIRYPDYGRRSPRGRQSNRSNLIDKEYYSG